MAAADSTVAIAIQNGKGSNRAARWASKHLVPFAHRVLFLHVIPSVAAVPSPSGESVPIDRIGREVVEMYVDDLKSKAQQDLAHFAKLYGLENAEILVLEGKNPASTIVSYVLDSGIKYLVLGSSSSWIRRVLKGPNVATSVLKSAPSSCTIFVVSRHNLSMRFTKYPASGLLVKDPVIYTQIGTVNHKVFAKSHKNSILHAESSINDMKGSDKLERLDSANASTYSQHSSNWSSYSEAYSENKLRSESKKRNYNILASLKDISVATLKPKKEGAPSTEALRLSMDLQNTLAMYNQVCVDLDRSRKKLQLLSIELYDEAKKEKDAPGRQKLSKKIAAEEKFEHLEAIKEVQGAKYLVSKDDADAFTSKVSSKTLHLMDAVITDANRCRRYSRKEIEVATCNFSDANKIGVGGYGNVYKGKLDHTPVAVKVFRQDNYDKKGEFLREVEILSQLHHPNMVLLLGICPEIGCLVYEYMENRSLEDLLFSNDNKRTLPWYIRFRIIFEVACGLAFLHGTKPEPIVHRDLKPGNILLDRNYVAKIGDVGIAKLMSNVVPDGLTEYNETMLAGTLYYMDPEYQRTGTLRPKSDLYALGVISLQLLTGKRPYGLIVSVEKAMSENRLLDVLDISVSDWPLVEAEKLAKLALRCSKLRCRDRPELETEVLPELEELKNMANNCLELERNSVFVPTHFICPLLQEILEDPYIAADGYTYEYRAIKAWLENSKISPVTKVELSNASLVPNHSLRSAIQKWKSQSALKLFKARQY